MSRVSFFTASSKEDTCAWCRCAHTVASPNAISPSMVFLGAIRRNAILPWGFSILPHAPAWESTNSSGCVISPTLNHVREGQMSWDPHSTWVNSSHQPGSLENAHNCLFLVVPATKENQLARGGSKQIPGGDAGRSALMSNPSYCDCLLVKSAQMYIMPGEIVWFWPICIVNMVKQKSNVRLEVLYCLRNEWACLPFELFILIWFRKILHGCFVVLLVKSKLR